MDPGTDRVPEHLRSRQNAWLEDRERRNGIVDPAQSRGGTRTGKLVQLSPALLRLARRLGVEPNDLAARYSADTLRRLKYAVVEDVGEDGSITYRQPVQIIDGPRALIQP